MTYNFDPERWHDDHLALLDARRARGELDGPGYEAAVKQLEREYEQMLDRLDGTYQLPTQPDED